MPTRTQRDARRKVVERLVDLLGTVDPPQAEATPQPQPSPTESDYLFGAKEIARHLGRNRRAVYHLARQGWCPIFKRGKMLIARKSQLEKALSAEPATIREQHEPPQVRGRRR